MPNDAFWKERLSDAQYHVMREKGTEPPFTGWLVDCHDDGTYHCAACNAPLFSSVAKFDSGSGWPSFDSVLHSESVVLREDKSLGMKRTEVLCAECDGHLGHLFDDGPTASHLRYCINSIALNFRQSKS